jgi:hypothetical protein
MHLGGSAMTSRLRFIRASQAQALRMFFAGKVPCFSTGIDDSLTAGYGDLDSYGFWEYDLPGFFIAQHGWDHGWQRLDDPLITEIVRNLSNERSSYGS